ncbi:MAG: phosphoribosylanthranilate isomerase [Clostridiales bacterium]|nr:phosphoribosylanthranilate isomerase [Clostridiales bacterium]
MTKIKICGLRRDEDVEMVNACKPNYIGFVFAKKSKRYITPEMALELVAKLSPKIKVVGVFVNEEPEIVGDLLTKGIIGIAQLHGQEDEGYIASLRQFTNKPIWKAFRIDTDDDIQKAIHSSADCILLDNGGGGTGTAFDWQLASAVNRPYFLAGGLGASNVANALGQISPYGVDVSSNVETNGVKDSLKVKAFIDAVRNMKEDSHG